MSTSSLRTSPLRKLLLALVVIAIVGLAWFFLWRTPAETLPPPPNPWSGPVPVRVVPATIEDLKVHIKAIGNVAPLNTVTVRSRVDGPLLRLLFNEGQHVNAGDVLLEIDAAPYKVKLDQAEGTLQQTRAQLKNAEDNLALYQRLFTQNSVAKQQLDTQIALVEQWKGTLKTHQAQVDDARLQLSYTKVSAPISGRLGLRRVDVGNLVTANDSTGLVTITQTSPIAALFTIPENQLSAVRRAFIASRDQQQPLTVDAWDRSEQEQLATGILTTLDNQIDSSTGTLRLKAEFANEDDSLFPNQFVNIRLHLSTLENVITIPTDAIQHGSRGTYVYIVDAEQKAVIRTITTGPQEGTRTAVLDGLSEGENVVIEGLDRLTEGRRADIM